MILYVLWYISVMITYIKVLCQKKSLFLHKSKLRCALYCLVSDVCKSDFLLTVVLYFNLNRNCRTKIWNWFCFVSEEFLYSAQMMSQITPLEVDILFLLCHLLHQTTWVALYFTSNLITAQLTTPSLIILLFLRMK